MQFGVRIPPPHIDDPVIAAQRRIYQWTLGAGGALVIAAGAALLTVWRQPLAGSVVAFGVIIVAVASYVRARSALLAVKTRDHWYAGTRQVLATDTALRTDPERFPWLWALPAVLIVLGTLVIGILKYPSMPAHLVIHYDAAGHPDRVAGKSVGTAFLLVYVQLFVTLLIVGLLAAVLRARADVDASAPRASVAAHRRSLQAIARAIPGRVHRCGQLDDDALWRGGLIYVNRDDPSMFVPRRFGVGWTLNFGNVSAIVLMAVIVVAAVGLPLVLAAATG